MDSMEFACYAESAYASQLSVSVTTHSKEGYFCDKHLDTTRGMTGGALWERYFYGGSLSHQVKLSTLCMANPSLSTHAGSCQAENFCAIGSFGIGCTGEEDCHANVSSFETTAVPGAVRNSCQQDFPLDAPVGDFCEYNVQCDSNTCIGNACVAEKLEIGSTGCEEDDDCLSGACASVSMGQLDEIICCESGQSLETEEGQHVCTGQSEGEDCFDDLLCESHVCLFGRCTLTQQETMMPC
ncbi:expressed unknown protein [Seminavis robusta]|uniref:Uncharacterized protein n=1 Tax=Seminavis robusta TaxID=568900 RepID=A0A9N8HF95_9STRA|nr:expressed unknown protein [Seminavis robusta]|eukprot:Sro557_g166180.1 n/a (240) ;mRNA; r:43372-44091